MDMLDIQWFICEFNSVVRSKAHVSLIGNQLKRRNIPFVFNLTKAQWSSV